MKRIKMGVTMLAAVAAIFCSLAFSGGQAAYAKGQITGAKAKTAITATQDVIRGKLCVRNEKQGVPCACQPGPSGPGRTCQPENN
jgi:hypothetical protein